METLDPSAEVAEQALARMQEVLDRHVPGVTFGEKRVRFNPLAGRYHGIILVRMPSSVPRDGALDLYDELISAHMSDHEREHLAVLVGWQGD